MTTAKSRLPSLSALSAIGGASLQGANTAAPTLLPLDKIEEDTTQPRSHFDREEMEELTASVRARGVIQPIGVVKVGEGYRIVFGARRFRAARMAALQVIPVVVLPEERASLDIQMIENIHRSDLRNSELVAGIIRMGQEGKSRKEIAALLGWTSERVKRCQALEGAPAVILQVLDGGTTIRAAYDLFYAWKKAPEAIEAAVSDRTGMSYDEVRSMIARALDTAPTKVVSPPDEVMAVPENASEPNEDNGTAELVQLPRDLSFTNGDDEQPAPPTAQSETDRGRPTPVEDAVQDEPETNDEGERAGRVRESVSARRSPRFIVTAGDRRGTLITDRTSDVEQHALVRFGGRTEDVPLDQLTLVEVT